MAHPRALPLRNALIRRMVESGVPLVDIGRRFNVSKQRIDQIARPRRAAARYAVKRALRRGDLVRPDRCEECGKRRPTEAHHRDYSRPLSVRFLCTPCHKDADARRAA